MRNFKSHASQLTSIAVKPDIAPQFLGQHNWMDQQQSVQNANPPRHVDDSYDLPDNLVSMQEVKSEERGNAGLPTVHQSNSSETQSAPVVTVGPAREDDSKSDASFDPLFDDEPDADGEGETDTGSQPPQSATQGSYLGQTSQSQPPQQMFQPPRGPPALAPKNAPPVLDAMSYTTYSPDVVMIASIDGQIVLWDKRVNTPGRGVGRLWMSEKTPPWCVSVSIYLFIMWIFCQKFDIQFLRRAGQQMAGRYMQGDVMKQWIYMTFGSLALLHPEFLVF